MKFDTTSLNYYNGAIQIPLPKGTETALEKLFDYLAKDKTLTVEIKLKSARRSLTANAALWAMLGDMAKVLHTTAEELYIKALRDYGISRFIAIDPPDYAQEVRCHRVVEERGYTYANGYKFMVLQVWDGSSKYDTKDFAYLLNGVIQDAKELGVEFISEADKALLLKEREEMYAKEVFLDKA